MNQTDHSPHRGNLRAIDTKEFVLRALPLCASLLATLPAQPRERVGGASFANDPDGFTYLEVDHQSERERLVWGDYHRPGDPAELDLPFDLPGEPLALGAHRFLVPGVSSSDRVATILCVRLDEPSRSILIEERRDYGTGIDPWKLCWNKDENRLYLLDFNAPQVRVATFSGGALPELARFVPIAASELAPELDPGPYITTMFASSGSPGVVLGTMTCLLPRHMTRLEPDPSGDWAAIPEMDGAFSTRVLAVDHGSHVNALGPMRVVGAAGGVRLDEATFVAREIAETTIVDPQMHVALSLPAAGVVPGLRYAIVQSWYWPDGREQFIPGFSFLALLRHGTPQTDSAAAMPFGQIAGRGAWTGNAAFSTIGWFGAGSNAHVPVELEIYLALSARHEDGTDPVRTRAHDTAYLSEVLALAGPFPLTIRDAARREGLQVELPIPDDHALEGGVLLMQWAAVTPRGDSAVSDVFGTMITPRWRGFLEAIAPDDPRVSWVTEAQARLPRLPATSVQAIRRWLAGKPEWAMNEARRARWREMTH